MAAGRAGADGVTDTTGASGFGGAEWPTQRKRVSYDTAEQQRLRLRTRRRRRAHVLWHVVPAGAPLRRGGAVLRHHAGRHRIRRRLPPHAGCSGRRPARVATLRLAIRRVAIRHSLRSSAVSVAQPLRGRAAGHTVEIDGTFTIAGSSCCALDCGACTARQLGLRSRSRSRAAAS